ncbi:MAG: glutaminase A [Corynebacteriales bacterium]|nr:glutaminase A [Mycobacteriales bacterium]
MASGPSSDVVTHALEEVWRAHRDTATGTVATYIPELAHASAEHFGLALTSMAGNRYHAGDADIRFTLQSVSKPFVYALALAELGADELSKWVNNEPSGEAFNAISLEPGSGRPANAMINAGAIAVTSLIRAATPALRCERILETLSAFAGRTLDIDERVYASEAAHGDRNRALAYLVHNARGLPIDPMEAVDIYFRQCAIRADVSDLATMAGTLANGGLNPVTKVRVVPEEVAVQVLSVMASCGMYNSSGDWLVNVGLPAKSGVSGALIAASPARFGVAAFSPPLDAMGNPVRGVSALRNVASRWGLHLMHHPSRTMETITELSVTKDSRSQLTITTLGVQGDVDFTAAERLLWALTHDAPAGSALLLDLRWVSVIDDLALAMLDTGLAPWRNNVAIVGMKWPGKTHFNNRDAALEYLAQLKRSS